MFVTPSVEAIREMAAGGKAQSEAFFASDGWRQRLERARVHGRGGGSGAGQAAGKRRRSKSPPHHVHHPHAPSSSESCEEEEAEDAGQRAMGRRRLSPLVAGPSVVAGALCATVALGLALSARAVDGISMP